MTITAESTDGMEHVLLQSFIYLDTLRDSGITNMLGSPPYLKNAYPEHFEGGDDKLLFNVVRVWMKTFDHTEEVESRVTKALKIL